MVKRGEDVREHWLFFRENCRDHFVNGRGGTLLEVAVLAGIVAVLLSYRRLVVR